MSLLFPAERSVTSALAPKIYFISYAEDFVDSATAAGRATITALRIRMQGLFIVDRDLFTGMNVPQGKKDYVTVDCANKGVGFAGVIYVMRSVTATAAVDAPNAVDITDAQLGSMGAALCFPIGNSLAGIFSDLSPVLEMNSGKAAAAVDL
jgi:hypothetical protein